MSRKHQKMRKLFINWQKRDPHFGESVDMLTRSRELLWTQLNTLTHDFSKHRVPFNEWLHQLHKVEADKAEIEEIYEVPIQRDEDVILMVELGDHKRRIEQLLRAVVFLNSAHKSDTEGIKAQLALLEAMSKPRKFATLDGGEPEDR